MLFLSSLLPFSSVLGDQVAKQADAEEDDELDEKVEGGTEEPEFIDVFVCSICTL
jgi:hypothetical protein